MRRRQRPLPALPRLWLLTDERIDDRRLVRAATRLPRGSGIILRHYDTNEAERRALFDALAHIARRKGLILSVAGTVTATIHLHADAVHGLPRDGSRFPDRQIATASVHDMQELRRAERAGADILFLSPLYATRSHPGARPLGVARFASLARRTRLPVIALGGVARRHAELVQRLGAAGWAAIDALCE